ncbi:hypothetical protein PROFUN_09104 [Planoprotostelium fungivorum]|uniref:Carboxypeptidase regulatory-like domain-containing protein n=1 Tax=Planoprotostelium fungivorum TaxID=1890364 RepID=A0A2P6NHW6_9EUKA|nr:hypothetical protein PROFUN_09104 [Planoprotostelium fungivorum]
MRIRFLLFALFSLVSADWNSCTYNDIDLSAFKTKTDTLWKGVPNDGSYTTQQWYFNLCQPLQNPNPTDYGTCSQGQAPPSVCQTWGEEGLSWSSLIADTNATFVPPQMEGAAVTVVSKGGPYPDQPPYPAQNMLLHLACGTGGIANITKDQNTGTWNIVWTDPSLCYELSGTVVDALTQKPLSNVTVVITSPDLSVLRATKTTDDGSWKFNVDHQGEYDFYFGATNYQTAGYTYQLDDKRGSFQMPLKRNAMARLKQF